jgi:UDP-N-acetylglucosamine 1-carboxyvinyltransferase
MTMAVATRGNVLIKNIIPKHLEAISSKLIEMGANVIEYDDSVRVMADGDLKATQIKTLPYPGFPTDMQAQMATVLGIASGTSLVTESIFENRFRYVSELTRMGAHIRVENNTAIITGTDKYTGARITASDLRAGAALVIAALAADGYSTIDEIQYIKRGYEDFDEKVRALGGHMEIVDSEREVQKFKLRVG